MYVHVHVQSTVSVNLSHFIVSGYYALGNSGRALVDTSIVISQIGDLSVSNIYFSETVSNENK